MAFNNRALRASTEKNLSIAVAVTLIIVTVVAFMPTLNNDFVNWDDGENFLRNTQYRGLGWAQMSWAWTTFHLGTYQPLGWALISVEHAFFALVPRGYFAVSIFIHAATALALYAVTLHLLRRAQVTRARGLVLYLCAGTAVALFAVHPLRVEAVAWVSCQSYLPCALFFVLAVHAYLRSCDADTSHHFAWLSVALLLYFFALLCKAPAVSLPAVLLILDVYPLRRLRGNLRELLGPSQRGVLYEKAPFVAVGVVFSAAAFMAKATTFNGAPLVGRGLLSRTAAACYAMSFYLFKTFDPRHLAAYYVMPGPEYWLRQPFLTCFVGVAGLTLGLLLSRRRWPGLTATWAASLVLVAPVSGFVSISTQLVADRYAYFLAMAWILPVAAGLAWLASLVPRSLRIGVVAVVSVPVIVILVLETRELCRSWRNSESLWRHALTHDAGRSMMAYNNLAAVYFDRAEIDEGIAICRAGLAKPWQPSDLTGRVLLHSNLATFLERQGHLEEAAAQFAEMAHLGRLGGDAEYRWGRVLAAQQRFEDAIPHFEEALRLKPDHSAAAAGLDAAMRLRSRMHEVPPFR